MSFTPKSSSKTLADAIETQSRVKQCRNVDLNWELHPSKLKLGCKQVGKAISISPTAVLSGLLIITSFCMSHASVAVPGTDWIEPIILWVSIGMPTGSGKSPLYKFLLSILRRCRARKAVAETSPAWLLQDATFEKMGAMMAENHSKILGLYDELSSFLTQINLYNRHGLSESHNLALFLQLYNGIPWSRNTVSGDANFIMEQTSLTVGGFTQPITARTLIEQPSNIEKGLSTRFLWIFPQPCYADFGSLEPINGEFADAIVDLLAEMWAPTDEMTNQYKNPTPRPTFSKKFDTIQRQLQAISGVDELLSGMLSKAKGLILRVAGVLHVLFHIDSPAKDISQEISVEALKAAENFVDVCCQHLSYIAGRGDIDEAILKIQQARERGSASNSLVAGTAAYILLLPGKILDISDLNKNHKFRGRGNKDGAVAAIMELEKEGLGVVKEERATRGTSKLYKFEKKVVPDGDNEKELFAELLLKYGISLKQYMAGLKTPRKRVADNIAPEPRRSPRLSDSHTPECPASSQAKRNLFS